jgi:hypothetical protein
MGPAHHFNYILCYDQRVRAHHLNYILRYAWACRPMISIIYYATLRACRPILIYLRSKQGSKWMDPYCPLNWSAQIRLSRYGCHLLVSKWSCQHVKVERPQKHLGSRDIWRQPLDNFDTNHYPGFPFAMPTTHGVHPFLLYHRARVRRAIRSYGSDGCEVELEVDPGEHGSDMEALSNHVTVMT